MPTGAGWIEKPRRPRRRTYTDNQQLAQPKPGVRLRSAAAMASDRSRHCERCGKWIGHDAGHRHHLKTRGAGGSDERWNTIDLCPLCHDRAHRAQAGYGKEDLRRIVEARQALAAPAPSVRAFRHPAQRARLEVVD